MSYPPGGHQQWQNSSGSQAFGQGAAQGHPDAGAPRANQPGTPSGNQQWQPRHFSHGPQRSPRTPLAVGAAAVGLVLVAAAVVMFLQGGKDETPPPPTSTQSSASQPPSPTSESPAPSPSQSPSSVASTPAPGSGPQDPGQYHQFALKQFDPPQNFDGWKSVSKPNRLMDIYMKDGTSMVTSLIPLPGGVQNLRDAFVEHVTVGPAVCGISLEQSKKPDPQSTCLVEMADGYAQSSSAAPPQEHAKIFMRWLAASKKKA